MSATPFVRSLVFKVGAAIILIEMAVLTVAGTVYIARFSGQVDQRIRSQVQLPGSLINAGLLRYESVADRRTMATIIEEELLEGMIVGVNGTVFLSLDPAHLGSAVHEVPEVDASLFDSTIEEPRIIRGRRTIVCVSPIYGADGSTLRFFAYLKAGTEVGQWEKTRLVLVFVSGSLITVLLTSVIIIFSFRWRILTRITDIVSVLARVEAGDLSARVSLPILQDELGTLQHGVDSMTSRLAETIGSLEAEIDQHTRTEVQLHASEERYRTLVESFTDIVYIVDRDRKLLFANPSLARITGFDVQEFSDVALIREHTHPEDKVRVRDFIADFVASDRLVSGDLESRFRDRDGSWHWFLSNITKISYSGTPALQTVVHDITQRKLAEEALKTRERYLSSLSRVSLWLVGRNPADSLGNVVALLGETVGVSRCTLVENEARDGKLIGRRRYQWYSEAAAETSGVNHLGDLDYADLGLERWMKTFGRGQIIAASTADLPENERTIFSSYGIQSVLMAPLMVSDMWHGILALEDHSTERGWQLEEDLIRIATSEISGAIENASLFNEVQNYALTMADQVAVRTGQLESLNRELEAFAYSVSHDLRAPLRSINGFSRTVLDSCGEDLDEANQGYLTRVINASQRMARMIDAMLELSRVGRRTLQRERLDLSELARSTWEELDHDGERPASEVEIADGLMVNGDPALLRLVLQNLLDNAAKFTARTPQPRIEVGLSDSGGERAYFVRDNGAGFDMKYADKLFGAFQRLHSDREYQGTGIGLATVQRIIQRHGGRIWAEAEVEKGATFFFTLP